MSHTKNIRTRIFTHFVCAKIRFSACLFIHRVLLLADTVDVMFWFLGLILFNTKYDALSERRGSFWNFLVILNESSNMIQTCALRTSILILCCVLIHMKWWKFLTSSCICHTVILRSVQLNRLVAMFSTTSKITNNWHNKVLAKSYILYKSLFVANYNCSS